MPVVPGLREEEVGGPRVLGQPWLNRETLSQKQKTTKKESSTKSEISCQFLRTEITVLSMAGNFNTVQIHTQPPREPVYSGA